MAHLESLVVLDPSQRSRDALTFGFARDGYEVFPAEDGADALTKVRENGVQLVVVATPDGTSRAADGKSQTTSALLKVVGRLREEEATRNLPIVVLGDRLGREEALRSGADEFVARPAFLRDVITLSKLAVALRLGAADPDEHTGISAALDDYGLYFLTRALAVAGRSARIRIVRGKRKGELAFAKGEVVGARVGGLRGVVAYQHLLMWGRASLELELASPAGERKLNVPVEELLGQGVVFVERFEAEAAALGGAEAIYGQVARRIAAVKAELPPTVFNLLKLCDGRRALIDLVEEGPFKPFDAIGVVARLLELGAIERVDDGSDADQRATAPRVPLREQLAVRDWLLGAKADEARTTVTEAGRRAAEAYAEEEARRATQTDPGDDLFDAPALGTNSPDPQNNKNVGGSKKKKKGKQARAAARQAQAAAVAKPATVATPTATPAPAPAPSPTTASNGHTNGNGEATKSPAAKLSAAAIAEAPVKEKLFDDVEEAFFAREVETPEPVDNFDDLAVTPKPKRSWSLFGLVRGPEPKKKK